MQRCYPWIVALAVAGIPGASVADGPVTTVFFTSSGSGGECPRSVSIARRMGDGDDEAFTGPLLDCAGRPRDEALRALSVLARPRGTAAPSAEALEAFDRAARPGFVAEGVRELHPELLERLQRLGAAFDGRVIEILSGYRPSSAPTSRHHHGRALDLRVRGVDREPVRDALVGLARTGVGWYPRSVFVHVDVRDERTYWVDESAPGEPPRSARASTEAASELDLETLRAETDAALSAIRVTPPPP